jgi:hypothetical protein
MEHTGRHEKKGGIVGLCNSSHCCPTAEFTADGVILRDDYQGEVRLTRDEWLALVAKIKNGELG